MEPRSLEEFLGELSGLMPVRGSQRTRALAEVEDHVLCGVEESLAQGQSYPDAVAASLARIGRARAAAASFAALRAERAVGRAQRLTAACVLAFVVLFMLGSQVTGIPADHAIGAGAAAALGTLAGTGLAVGSIREHGFSGGPRDALLTIGARRQFS